MHKSDLPNAFVLVREGETKLYVKIKDRNDYYVHKYYGHNWVSEGVFTSVPPVLEPEVFVPYLTYAAVVAELQKQKQQAIILHQALGSSLNVLNCKGVQTGRFSSEKPNASFVEKEEGPHAAEILADDNFITQCKLAFAGILAISPEKYKNMVDSLAESTGYLPTDAFQTAVRAELEAWDPLPEDM